MRLRRIVLQCSHLIAGLVMCFSGTCVCRADTAHFLMIGPHRLHSHPEFQSYVVAIEDPVLIQQARDFLRSGVNAPYLVPVGTAVEGATPYNLDFGAENGPRQWLWYINNVQAWAPYDPNAGEPAVFVPELHSAPSDVLELVRRRGGAARIQLVNYRLSAELPSSNAHSAVVNVSTRGFAGTGEEVLIAGLVIAGDRPRNIVVRGLGPSLRHLGVKDAIDDPKITLFRAQDKIAQNDNWNDGNIGDAPKRYVLYAPGDLKEAAMWVLLPPGAYTIVLNSSGDQHGIGLIEAYDLTPMDQPPEGILRQNHR